LRLLKQLTDVGDFAEKDFLARLKEVQTDPYQRMLVMEDAKTHRVIATGSLMIEPKFIHEAGLVGHIEDCVVEETMRDKGLGRMIVEQLKRLARETGCYKCILDCQEKNVPFYERCGFKRKEVMMTQYFSPDVCARNPSGIATFDAEEENGLLIRNLESSDYNAGFISLLSQLTTVGNIPEAFFQSRLQQIQKSRRQHMLVVQDTATGQIVATATLLIERKFIHNAGFAAHIEDVVSDESVRGKGLGKRIINALVQLAQKCGCYKVILDCEEHNIKFYEKCGFILKEVEMACYFN